MKNRFVFLFCLAIFTVKAFAQQDSSAAAQILLPLQVASLDASVLNKNVQLVWTVSGNEEAKAFEIERAGEDGRFQKVGSKLALNRSGQAGYEFVDALPKKNVSLSYRIKIIARDGADVYSSTHTARIADGGLQCRLKQNPVRSTIQVEIISAAAGTVVASVYTAYGQKASTETTKLSTGSNLLSFSAQNLLPGLYRLSLESGAERALLSFVKE